MRRATVAAATLAAFAFSIPAAFGFVAPEFILTWGQLGFASGEFNFAHFLTTTPAGDVYVADFLNDRVQRFNSTGGYVGQWSVVQPNGIAVAPDGSVYVSHGDQVSRYTAAGAPLATWGGTGTGEGQFQFALDVAVDADGFVYVGDWQNHRVQKFTANGGFVTQWGGEGTGNGQFVMAFGLAYDPAGFLLVADAQADRVQKFTLSGVYVASFTVDGPGRPWVDAEGFVIVPETPQQRIRVFRGDGSFVTEWGEFGTAPGQFHHPTAVAVDGTGSIYVMDKDNHRVQKFAAVVTPARTTSWGSLKARFR